MSDLNHSPERAALLHAVRWDRKENQAAIDRIGAHPPKVVLVAVMDAVFMIETAVAALNAGFGTNGVEAHLRNALDALLRLVEPAAPIDVIDVQED